MSDGGGHDRKPGGRDARGARAQARLARMADHDRSQEDRDPVLLPHLHLLHRRWGRGAGDAPAAGGPGHHARQPRDLQRPGLDARHHDGLPVRGAGDGGVRQLLGAADDRRPRHGVPAAERAVVLAAGVRRHRVLHEPLLRAAPGGLDLVRAALRRRLHAGRRRRRLDLPDPPDRPVVAAGRDQLRGDDPQHAREGHGLGPDAAVRVVDPRLQLPADRRAAGGGGGGHDAAHRPPLRHRLLRPDRRRRPDAVAAPVLVLRPPRGLHHGPARVRDHLGDPAGVRPQADLRLQGDRGRHRGHRVPGHAGVGAPHVHHADLHGRAGVLHAQLVPDRRAHGHQDLQLDRDPVEGLDRDEDAALLRGRASRRCS